jgi:hypothetical protein
MRRVVAAAATVAAVTAFSAMGSPAPADDGQSKVVSANPADATPHALDGRVYAFAVVGSKVVVGGSFTQIRDAGSRTTINQRYLFAYDRMTGKIDTGFKPVLDHQVFALAPGPSGTVYAGGAFTTVNRSADKGLVRLDTTNGSRSGKNWLGAGDVRDLIASGSRLYVGGQFTTINGVARSRLARLDSSTGKVDSFAFTFSDPINDAALKIYDMALSPDGSKLVVTGSFTKVDGRSLPQVAMFNTSGSLSSWATGRYGDVCSPAFDSYIRDVDFDPTGAYFAIVTTGGAFGDKALCDSAARWDATKTGAGQQPVWVNWTGGDTLMSVSVTGAAVYVGGHQRWLDNRYGDDTAGPGAVERPGIGALSPATGKALAWNPTRTRGHGVETLDAFADGLLVGSDTGQLGHEYHARLGLFPLP